MLSRRTLRCRLAPPFPSPFPPLPRPDMAACFVCEVACYRGKVSNDCCGNVVRRCRGMASCKPANWCVDLHHASEHIDWVVHEGMRKGFCMQIQTIRVRTGCLIVIVPRHLMLRYKHAKICRRKVIHPKTSSPLSWSRSKSSKQPWLVPSRQPASPPEARPLASSWPQRQLASQPPPPEE